MKNRRKPLLNAVIVFIAVTFSSITGPYAQTITAISPDTAWQGQTVQVTISGTQLNFVQGTGTKLWIRQNTDSVTAVATNIQANSLQGVLNISGNVPVGFYDVLVGGPGVTSISLSDGFEVIASPLVLPPPTLISPSNGAALNSNPVNFTWGNVNGAVNYEYEIAVFADFNQVVESGTTPDGLITLPIQGDAYYWRVRTGNIASVYGAWSSVFQFSYSGQTALTSIVPNSGYQGQNLSVTISGVDISFHQGTPTVQFELENNGTTIPILTNRTEQFNGTNFIFSGVGNLSIPLSAPTGLYDLNYTDPSNQDYILPQSFEVLIAPPTPVAPTLISPIDGILLSSNPVQFTWSEPTNAVQYHIQINTSADFTDPLFDIDGIGQAMHQQSLIGGTYYWRVRAVNLSNLWSNWSSVEDFELVDVSFLTDMNPDQGHAGQNGLGVTISGVNMTFVAGTSTTADIRLVQNSYEIQSSSTFGNSPSQVSAVFDIPLAAPTGYYDLWYEEAPFTALGLENAFYVHDGNEYSGQVYVDYNQNQIYDSGDVAYPYAVVSTLPEASYSTSQQNGVYNGFIATGSHTLSLETLGAYTISPPNYTISFIGSGGTSTGNDFALQPIPGMQDLFISLNAGIVRQGRNMTLTITIGNQGATVESGIVGIDFPVGMTVTSSSDPGYVVNGTNVSWTFSNLQPIEQVQIQVELFAPQTFQVGQLLSFTGQVNGQSTDTTPLDNTFILDNQVVNSYDPNFKEVSPSQYITQEFIDNGEYLNYTVHFQNIGTAEALDVYILDTISDLLDLSTFQFITARHTAEVNMLNDWVIEFRFDGINLPDSTTNEPESHGFVSYRITHLSL